MTRPPDPSLLAHAVERAPDGVLIVDADGIIVYANRAIHHLSGHPELVGASVDELVPEAVRAPHRELRAEFERAPRPRPMGAGLELALQGADGTRIPVEISLSPFEHEGAYVITAVRDIRDRLAAQHRLAAAHEQLALIAERERIGRDLHDVVLQHLYGTGLSVQAIGATTDPPTADRLDGVIDEIDRIIAEVRTIVFTLGTSGHRGALGQELADVVVQASRVLGFTPTLRIDGPVESALTDDVRAEMVASMREALGNVARHAGATHAHVTVELTDGRVVMTVVDNGIGPPDDDATLRGGHGLRNLKTRAAAFGGSCVLGPRHTADETVAGAILRWSVPY